MFDVLGEPAPKGSMTAMLIGGRPVAIAGTSSKGRKRMRAFDTVVREAARAAVGDVSSPPFVGVPLGVDLTFRLARPASHWSKRGGLTPRSPRIPCTKPDLDKLARQLLDSLTGIVFDDDSRIARCSILKTYGLPGEEGARVLIWAISESEMVHARRAVPTVAESLAAGGDVLSEDDFG